MPPTGSSAMQPQTVASNSSKLKKLLSTTGSDQFHVVAGKLSGGLAVDSAGRIFFGNGNNIGSIEPDGSVFPHQSFCQRGGSIDGDTDTSCFANVGLLCMDDQDNLYIADAGLLRKADPEFTVTTIADLHQDLGYDFRPLIEITGLAADSSRHVYFGAVVFVYDGRNDKYRILERSVVRMSSGGIVSEVYDLPQLESMGAIRLDATQNLYLISSTRILCRSPDGHMAVLAELGGDCRPYDIVIDSGGRAYVSDLAQHCVHRITPDGDISTVAQLNSPGAMTWLGPSRLAVIARDGIYELDTRQSPIILKPRTRFPLNSNRKANQS